MQRPVWVTEIKLLIISWVTSPSFTEETLFPKTIGLAYFYENVCTPSTIELFFFNLRKWNNSYTLLKCKNIYYDVKNRIRILSMNYLFHKKMNSDYISQRFTKSPSLWSFSSVPKQQEEPYKFPVIISPWKPVHKIETKADFFY